MPRIDPLIGLSINEIWASLPTVTVSDSGDAVSVYAAGPGQTMMLPRRIRHANGGSPGSRCHRSFTQKAAIWHQVVPVIRAMVNKVAGIATIKDRVDEDAYNFCIPSPCQFAIVAGAGIANP